MANINSALHSLQYMQENAQEALPILPNNGNPAGAYNMPAAIPTKPMAAGAPPVPMQKPALADKYPWLRPSPSVDNIRRLLQNRQQPVMPNMRAMIP